VASTVTERSVGAARAYRLMAIHFDSCQLCQLVGAELAQLRQLCPEGRRRRQRWERAELRELDRRRVER